MNSKALIKKRKAAGWEKVGCKGDREKFKHPENRGM